MNTRTKAELLSFIEAVEELAKGCVHLCGVDNVTKVLDAGHKLKYALEKDETLSTIR